VTAGTELVRGVSVSHERAAVQDLETAGFESQQAGVEQLLGKPGVREAFVLQTCNRVEAYVVESGEAADALAAVTDAVPADATVELGHGESLRHLLRVAAGLESVVVGEDQILGQVRDAYADARAAGGIDTVFEDAVTKALHVGERARTETAINEGTLSLASAAVSVATDECDLTGRTGLVVGAGEMGRHAAKALSTAVDELVVANRTVPHAEYVASEVDIDATAVGLDAVPSTIPEATVVVSATDAPAPIIDESAFADAGQTVVVDLAQPRDVPAAVGDRAEITLADLDTLESLTAETRAERHEAAEAVEAMVDEEFDHLLTQFKRKRADRVVAAMYESAERIKRAELETALGKLDLDEDQEEVIESMTDAVVSELLAAPTQSLRDAAEEDDWSTIQTALQLFDPNFGPSEAGGVDIPMDADEVAGGGAMPQTVLDQLSDD
jgi:glutamyl-tRNA reductase